MDNESFPLPEGERSVYQGRFVLTDSYSQDRTGEDLLVATATVRRGELVPGGGGLRMRHRAE